ncbi:hypothetical protein GCM10007082_29620 [Oceanisphaera arctica]|nr:hypothetical protein GCM10007082_29620 [Oceanisphaera arctica]
MFDLAEADGIGSFIELVPNLDDPRDLFTLTRGGQKHSRLRKAAWPEPRLTGSPTPT